MPLYQVDQPEDAVIEDRTLVNIYGCSIGAKTKIGRFVEIQKNSSVGANCEIGAHTFICEGVRIEDDVQIGVGVAFTNDRFPRAANELGEIAGESDWEVVPTLVRAGAVIGPNVTILCGLTIGREAVISAGSVVTRSIPDGAVAMGVPARVKPRPGLEARLRPTVPSHPERSAAS